MRRQHLPIRPSWRVQTTFKIIEKHTCYSITPSRPDSKLSVSCDVAYLRYIHTVFGSLFAGAGVP